MAVYSSKFATRNVAPGVGRNLRHVKRFASGLLVMVVVALGVLGLWRATVGVPDPGEYPASVAE